MTAPKVLLAEVDLFEVDRIARNIRVVAHYVREGRDDAADKLDALANRLTWIREPADKRDELTERMERIVAMDGKRP